MAPHDASNESEPTVWNCLRRACMAAAQSGEGAFPLEHVLQWAAQATGFERAFLVEVGEDERAVLRGRWSARTDGCDRPSRSTLRRALAARRPILALDVGDDPLKCIDSVRSLSLRFVLAAALPVRGDRPRGALVLDSRRAAGFGEPALGELAGAFAALTAIVASRTPSFAVTPKTAGRPDVFNTRCDAYRAMLSWIDHVAASDLPVLVQGESGSGKEVVSRHIHARSARRDGPFVALNCTALPETLMEAELFGARKGAYTGADRDRPGLFKQANGGSLFLDEVGDMPPALQAKLLRVLEEKRLRPLGSAEEITIDARVIAASHRDLDACVRQGSFRADLYYRIAVLEVPVPPLRERLADLPLIVEALAPRLEKETGLAPLRLTEAAWERLAGHDWPGNVRELHATLARGLIRARGEPISAAHLDTPRARTLVPSVLPGTDDLERRMILAALGGARGNLSRAARHIGWTRQKLYRRLEALGIERPS